ncbi:MAG: pitrilysin family protein [Planctomycetota bacterium]
MAPRIELQIAERDLDNGLTLIAVQNPGVSTFACGVVLQADVRNEARGEEGLANLVGDCLDEGTRARSGPALAEAIENLGGGLEGNTSGASLWCPVAVAKKALPLLVETVTQPAFPAREVARVRSEVLADIQSDLEDPQVVAGLRFRAEVYGDHPFARPLKGTPARLARYGRVDLARFHRRWFAPRGGLVAASGPLEPRATLDMLARAFRGFAGPAHPRPACPQPALSKKRRDMHVSMRREQVHVYMGHVGVRRSDPDFYALSVMDHVLGTGPGFTSRVTKRLRDEMGLCYSVFAGITANAGEEPGTFTSYIGTSAEHRAQAIEVFLAEIERLRHEPPSAEEVRDVQDYLTGSFALGLERNLNLIRYAVLTKRFGLGFDYVLRYPDLVRAVTPDEVQRVAQAHLHPDRVVVVSAGAGK